MWAKTKIQLHQSSGQVLIVYAHSRRKSNAFGMQDLDHAQKIQLPMLKLRLNLVQILSLPPKSRPNPTKPAQIQSTSP